MSDEKREWEKIQIYYQYGDWVELRRSDLEKIEAIDDVITALQQAKTLVKSLQGILGE